MSQRGGGRGSSGAKKRLSVSYTIRDVSEPFNRAGVNALAVDHEQKLLYTAGRDAIIRCWDVSEAHGKKQCKYVRSMEHHTDWVNDITLCGNGRYMMSASSDTTLKVWDTVKGSCLSTLRTHKDYVRCLGYAKERELVASAGLDRIIYLWDIKTLTSLTAAKNTVTTTTLPGHKESIYSIAMNDAGSVLVSGSTEKMLRVWDPRTNSKIMKLKGHTDNVRTVLLNREGSLCLSGSSDGTVRLWSLGQQRCVETFRVHDEGVWALAADEEFEVFYSGGRDRQVCATELTQGGQEGVVLFCEESAILDLKLDPSDDCTSIWAATASTHVNKWPVDPASMTNGKMSEGEEEGEMEVEEDVGITDIDDPQPLFCQPLATVPGGRNIRDFRILSNRQQVLTKDSSGEVALWDVFHAVKEVELGNVDIDEEAENRRGKLYIPNWFSVEVKTGMLTIRLEESDCFSAWVLGTDARLTNTVPELKLNLGALTLQALFENWPSTHTTPIQEETKTVEKGSSPAPPPQLDDLMEVCGGEAVKDWEGLGKAMSVPENKLEEISLTHKNDAEKCKEQLFKVWLRESEDVTWERIIEVLASLGQDDIAKSVREKFCSPPENEEVSKPANQSLREKVARYFRVPDHTPVVLSEVGDCGTTMMRFLCGDAAGTHENRQLNNFCPAWVMDIVCQKKLPDAIKINFSLGKYEPGKKEGKTSGDRLSAQDLLTIRKVHDYAYNKLYGEDGKVGEDGEKLEADTCLEVLCMDQVLDKELDLRTVKYSIWKSSGDMRLYYREIHPSPKTTAASTGKEKSADTAESDKDKTADTADSSKGGSEETKSGNVEESEKEKATPVSDSQEGEKSNGDSPKEEKGEEESKETKDSEKSNSKEVAEGRTDHEENQA